MQSTNNQTTTCNKEFHFLNKWEKDGFRCDCGEKFIPKSLPKKPKKRLFLVVKEYITNLCNQR